MTARAGVAMRGVGARAEAGAREGVEAGAREALGARLDGEEVARLLLAREEDAAKGALRDRPDHLEVDDARHRRAQRRAARPRAARPRAARAHERGGGERRRCGRRPGGPGACVGRCTLRLLPFHGGRHVHGRRLGGGATGLLLARLGRARLGWGVGARVATARGGRALQRALQRLLRREAHLLRARRREQPERHALLERELAHARHDGASREVVPPLQLAEHVLQRGDHLELGGRLGLALGFGLGCFGLEQGLGVGVGPGVR